LYFDERQFRKRWAYNLNSGKFEEWRLGPVYERLSKPVEAMKYNSLRKFIQNVVADSAQMHKALIDVTPHLTMESIVELMEVKIIPFLKETD
jgi:uncharacterized phage-associated protein